jgi:hypothetical protein
LPDLKNTSTEVEDEKRKYLLEEIGRERFCSCIRHAFPCTQKGERDRERERERERERILFFWAERGVT